MVIAQISDIHAAPDNDNLDRLERVLSWLDAVNPDALVVSGDLTDNDWLQGYEAIKSTLFARNYPAFILPGNSDNREMMFNVWNKGQHPGTSLHSDAFHFTANVGNISLIGLDSTVAGSPSGSVIPHLSWLKKALAANRSDALIIFLHHHVFHSGIPTIDETMCEGSAELGKLLKIHLQKPVAIASGHVHRPVASILGDALCAIPAYICGSVCRENPLWFGGDIVPPVNNPPSLMIHRFADNLLTHHPVWV